jgi:DNA polymerase III gamma/tau subunit
MNSALDKIPGQERIKQILNNFLQSKSIPHAFLFAGIDGIGKDNAALQFEGNIMDLALNQKTEIDRQFQNLI